MLDLLIRLAEKSLVVVEAQGDRHRLLDTVRQYAQERLDESGGAHDARERHLTFYLAFADSARPKLVGPEQAAWLARLDAEHENLLAAHAWCAHSPNGGDAGLKLVNDVKQYWVSRGQLGVRHRLTIEALAHPQASRRDLARCRGLFNAGQVCCFMGRYDEASGYLAESLAIARELADAARIEAVLQLLGLASLGRGDIAAARGYLEEALDLAREQGNQGEIAAAVNGLAQFHRTIGALDAAEPLYEEVLSIAREMGDREIVAIVELNLAMVAVSRGADERARSLLRAALATAREIGSRPVGQSSIEVTAGRAASRGEWESAARLFGAAEAQAALTGLRRDPADEAFLVPLMERTRAALGSERFAETENAGRRLGYDAAIVEADEALLR